MGTADASLPSVLVARDNRSVERTNMRSGDLDTADGKVQRAYTKGGDWFDPSLLNAGIVLLDSLVLSCYCYCRWRPLQRCQDSV